MAAIAEAFNWRNIIVIYEDIDFERDTIAYLVDTFQEKNIFVTYKISIEGSVVDGKIIEELHKISTFQTKIFVVHMSRLGLVSQLLINAKKLGMMSRGNAWLMTATTTNLFYSIDSSLVDSMQGVLGLKFYIPTSKGLQNLTSRLRMKLYIENPIMDVMEFGAPAIWAYDSIRVLANAVERAKVLKGFPTSNKKSQENVTSYFLDDLHKFSSLKEYGSLLLKEIVKTKFNGLSGSIQFVNGKLLLPDKFEIVNFLGKGERRVGFWNNFHGNKSTEGQKLLSPHDLEPIIWPGRLTTTPNCHSMIKSLIKLKIIVPVKKGFKELVRVDHDQQSNKTYVTGFCIDVFKAAIKLLPYQVEYEFVPFDINGNGKVVATYNDLVYQVFLQNYDAAVGDITILANRSLYVDFTQPFSDLGVGMLVRDENRNMWIFLKPLSTNLWITTTGFFLLTGFVVWLIEHPINQEFQGSISQQIGTMFWFSFSTLVFAHKEKLLNNLSKFVVIVWVFAVLILTSSYTATLSSMMTIQQINQLNVGTSYVGYQSSLVANQGEIINLNFRWLKYLRSPEEFAEALSRGSKHGGVSAIIDEIPYIKTFITRYDPHHHYAMIKSDSITNGFGFVFRKGSPMVQDMSRVIATLREKGELANLEKVWFPSKSSLMSEDSSKEANALNLESFGGLFIISGITSTMALFLFFIFYLRGKWHALKNYGLVLLGRQVTRMVSVTKYLSNRVHNRNITINQEESNISI